MRFAKWLVERGVFTQLPSWQELYDWSIQEANSFWTLLPQFLQTMFIRQPDFEQDAFVAEDPQSHLLGSWFEEARLNYAQNLLEHQSRSDSDLFCVCANDSGEIREYTRKEVKALVAALQEWLLDRGIQKGDRVGAVVCNGIEAIAGFLACASIGAVWSSCSPDFGVKAVVDRFSELKPKLLIANLSVQYAGKSFDKTEDLKQIAAQLPSVCGLLVSTPARFLEDTWQLDGRQVAVANWADASTSAEPGSNESLYYFRLDFDDPLYVLFSSGTTGKPKCIVHAVGRALLQHQKELCLHTDLKPGERILFFTTCGWMMWNWLVSAPSVGAVPVFFDGSPAHPDFAAYWKKVQACKVDVLGTSPKYIRGMMQKGFSPKPYAGGLKAVLSTGAPLLPEQFDWVYQNVKQDLHLASISGGTDIVSCFMLGNPLLAVHRGELQAPGLGMAVEVWDEDGHRLDKGDAEQEGELVCTKPFVSMPIGFWNDGDGQKIRSSYFARFPGVWHHGDYLAVNPQTGGYKIGGRSDATLNPGGVRIGTAELYRSLESIAAIEDCVAVSDPQSPGAEILLFVVTDSDLKELTKVIRRHLREALSPRHVPAQVIEVSKIPYTRSGKKVEVAIRKILAGKIVSSQSALVDASALDDFASFQASRVAT